MVAKFADHLPLYRQEKIFGRAGLAIPRSTLAQWVGQTGVQLQPLVDALREAVLAHGARREENASSLCLGLLYDAVLGPQGGGLRLQPQPRRRTCAQLLGHLERQAGL